LEYKVLIGIEEIGKDRWSALVDENEFGTVFQSPEIYDVFDGTALMDPVVVGCEDKKGQLVGVLLAVVIREQTGIKGFFSSRTVVYGGPLIQSPAPNNQQLATCNKSLIFSSPPSSNKSANAPSSSSSETSPAFCMTMSQCSKKTDSGSTTA
jgi:hypothetical protein